MSSSINIYPNSITANYSVKRDPSEISCGWISIETGHEKVTLHGVSEQLDQLASDFSDLKDPSRPVIFTSYRVRLTRDGEIEVEAYVEGWNDAQNLIGAWCKQGESYSGSYDPCQGTVTDLDLAAQRARK